MLTDTSDDAETIPLGSIRGSGRAGRSESLTSVSVGDQTVVIVSEPVRNGSQVVGVIQTGSNRTDVEETLAALLIGLGIAAPIMVVLAAGGGYVVAGRALRPVSQITDLAAGIGADDLHARLNLTLPDDELGRLASTFDAMLARIEEAFERQRRFTGDAAHELRTPLSLMRSQVDLALARPRTVGEYEEALAELDQDLARMTGLVATLLSLARSDSGILTLDRSDIDLADTIELICEQYADPAEAAGISLTASTEPTSINADEDLLIQVLVNLLDNALAATPEGGSIVVTCHPKQTAARISRSPTMAPALLLSIWGAFSIASIASIRAVREGKGERDSDSASARQLSKRMAAPSLWLARSGLERLLTSGSQPPRR